MPKLTDRLLAGLKIEPGRKDRLVFDTTCPGLGVRLTSTGKRTFLAQWTDPATKRKVRERIGVWGSLTVDQARDATRLRLGEVAKGMNPKAERIRQGRDAERERAETAMTFEDLLEEWRSLHLINRRPRYAVEAIRSLRVGLPHLLALPAARITRAEAVAALDGLTRAGKTVTASRTMAYARAAFSWAMRRGQVPANPFQNLPISPGHTQRDRVLTDVELRSAWIVAQALPYPWGPFYRLTMLTLQRRDEVAGMRWSEISEPAAVWQIPGARMKNGKPHDVHLSLAALDTLRSLPRVEGVDLVFTTTGKSAVSGFSRAKANLDAGMVSFLAMHRAVSSEPVPKLAPWRLHDLRRTGVSTLARLGFDSVVVDLILAHQPTRLTGVARVYQRYNFASERARALDAWADFLDEKATENVIPLTRRAVG